MYNPPHPFHGFRGENIHIAHKCNRCKQLSGGITTVLFSKTSFFWKGATWMRMVLDCNYYIHFCPLSHLYLFYILISININRWAAYIILVAIAPCFFLISLPLCLVSCLFYQQCNSYFLQLVLGVEVHTSTLSRQHASHHRHCSLKYLALRSVPQVVGLYFFVSCHYWKLYIILPLF